MKGYLKKIQNTENIVILYISQYDQLKRESLWMSMKKTDPHTTIQLLILQSIFIINQIKWDHGGIFCFWKIEVSLYMTCQVLIVLRLSCEQSAFQVSSHENFFWNSSTSTISSTHPAFPIKISTSQTWNTEENNISETEHFLTFGYKIQKTCQSK